MNTIHIPALCNTYLFDYIYIYLYTPGYRELDVVLAQAYSVQYREYDMRRRARILDVSLSLSLS